MENAIDEFQKGIILGIWLPMIDEPFNISIVCCI